MTVRALASAAPSAPATSAATGLAVTSLPLLATVAKEKVPDKTPTKTAATAAPAAPATSGKGEVWRSLQRRGPTRAEGAVGSTVSKTRESPRCVIASPPAAAP
ncbi:MAG: hypothetical protein U0235_24160 [Polyangiaceae bacterium]